MTREQQQYIEQNIDLIENNEWNKFFENAPDDGIGVILYEAGIEFLPYMTRIPAGCFYTYGKIPCNMTSIDIPDCIHTIEGWAFQGCDSLTNVILGNGIKEIQKNAFADCTNLTVLKFPKNLRYIGRCIVAGAPIKKLYFNGTMAEWQNVEQDEEAFLYINIRTIKCTDGVTKLRH